MPIMAADKIRSIDIIKLLQKQAKQCGGKVLAVADSQGKQHALRNLHSAIIVKDVNPHPQQELASYVALISYMCQFA